MTYLVSFLLCSWMITAVENSNGGQPPRITRHPKAEIAYKELEPVELDCDAQGFPKPQFYWEKDGVRLNLSGEVVQKEGFGKLTIMKPTSTLHDGVYQCFVHNHYGVAVSMKAYLKRAELQTFPSAAVETITAEIGSSLSLKCDPPHSYPAGVIYWGISRTGAKLQSIENSDRVSLDYDGGLYFSNIESSDFLEDSSTYMCISESLVLRALVQGNDKKVIPKDPSSSTGNATYRSPAIMWSSPTKETAILGQNKKMKCIFGGYPTPVVTWSRIGASLPPKVIVTGQEIEIPSISVEDEGLYKCTGSNARRVGSDPTYVNRNFTLVVESSPSWRHDRPPQDKTVSEDEVVEFECSAIGNPNPSITWTFNGRPLEDMEEDRRPQVSGNKVKFERVTQNDSQVLQCMAANVHGHILANAFLFVRAERPSILQTLPDMTKVPENKTVILKCRMDGAPKPVITWSRDKFEGPITDRRFRTLPTGDLEISNPVIGDSDVYHCNGTNKFGDETVNGRLIVRKKTVITEAPGNQTVNVSNRVEFKCEVVSDPEEILSVTWYKDDVELNLTGHGSMFLSGSTLVIDPATVADTGNYRCLYDNGVDTDESTAQLTVKDRPDPPTDVRITECKSSSAIISWSAGKDNNDPIEEYIIYYNVSYDPSGTYHEGPRVSVLTANINNLKHWTSYTFHVRARNSYGVSEPSSFTQGACSTSETIPFQSPKGVCTRNGKDGELVITWTPLPRSEHNADGLRYIVKYQEVSETNSTVTFVGEPEEILADGRQNEAIIKDQGIYQLFRITILAVNDEGRAPERTATPVLGHSSEGAPSVTPENFKIKEDTLNSTSVLFTWDPVDTSPESINGEFLGYRVLFWRKNNQDDVRTEEKILHRPKGLCRPVSRRRRREASEPVSVMTHGLWGRSEIVAAVVVVNGAHSGTQSDTVEFTTPEGVPDIVTGLLVTERGTHHLRLQWNEPAEINGILTAYIVGYKDVKNLSATWRQFVVNPQSTSAKLHGLLPETTYSIFVEGRTKTGGGPRLYMEDTTLAESGPPDVPHIEDTEIGENFAVVRWRPSIHNPAKNPGSKFHVEYEETDSRKKNKSHVEEQHNWINLTDLSDGAKYKVVVVASSGTGVETRSEPKEFFLSHSKEPVVHASSIDLWLILLILAIIIFLLLLILLICCLTKRCRQGKYAVYEKEKLHGCNPDDEAAEPTFGEYTKSNVPATLAAGPGSVDSIEKPLDSDTNSLAEYEETDPAKFNEDGSFIGQYGGLKKEVHLDQNAPFAAIV